MSNNSKLILSFIVGVLVTLSFQGLTADRQKQIILPEEINEAVENDTLKVSRVTVDSIFIDFDNLRNR